MAKIKERLDDYKPDPKLVDERGPTEQRKARLRPSPINMAFKRNDLTRAQVSAAEKFYNHWHRSGLVVSIPSVDLDRVFGGEGFQVMPKTESQAFHRDRWRKAQKLIEDDKRAGKIAFWVLEQVVCDEKPLTEVGAFMGHTNRNKCTDVALGFLRVSLNLLCAEWGIS